MLTHIHTTFSSTHIYTPHSHLHTYTHHILIYTHIHTTFSCMSTFVTHTIKPIHTLIRQNLHTHSHTQTYAVHKTPKETRYPAGARILQHPRAVGEAGQPATRPCCAWVRVRPCVCVCARVCVYVCTCMCVCVCVMHG
jgi:hypothetical protein